MAQLLIRNLDNETKERLRHRAALSGLSMETEARLILQNELAKSVSAEGIGTQIARIMEGIDGEFTIPDDPNENLNLFEFSSG